jgi:competence protein ComEA
MRIPQVGEVRANRIIEGRPYGSVDELLRVKGIGEKRLEMMREWVFVSPSM